MKPPAGSPFPVSSELILGERAAWQMVGGARCRSDLRQRCFTIRCCGQRMWLVRTVTLPSGIDVESLSPRSRQLQQASVRHERLCEVCGHTERTDQHDPAAGERVVWGVFAGAAGVAILMVSLSCGVLAIPGAALTAFSPWLFLRGLDMRL